MELKHVRIQQEPVTALVGDFEDLLAEDNITVKARVTIPFTDPQIAGHILALKAILAANAERGLNIERRNIPEPTTHRTRNRNERRGRATREAQKAG